MKEIIKATDLLKFKFEEEEIQLTDDDIDYINEFITNAFESTWTHFNAASKQAILYPSTFDRDGELPGSLNFTDYLTKWNKTKRVRLAEKVQKLINDAGYEVIWRQGKGTFLKIKTCSKFKT